MSSEAKVSVYWSGLKRGVSRSTIQILALGIIAIIAYFKIKPIFEYKPTVTIFNRTDEPQRVREEKASFNFQKYLLGKGNETSGRANLSRSYGVSPNSIQGVVAPRVLERPLFDGKSVIIQAQLSNSLDSAVGDPNVEAKVIAVIDQDQTGSIDSSLVDNGVIRGVSQTNFDAKRFAVQFTELLTNDGKTLQIAGVAFNPADSTVGIPADYSSGMPARLLGTALNRAILTADQVAVTRVLENPSDDPVTRELNRTAQQGSTEAANGIADTATKSLRETKAVLQLKAGSLFFVKIQAGRQNGRFR